MSESILSIDPGKATGWSSWVIGDEMPMTRVDFGYISATEFVSWFWDQAPRYDHIIFERFRLGGDVVYPDLSPEFLRGEAQAVVELHGLPPLIYRYRFQKGEHVVSEEILRRHDLWVTGAPIGWEDGRDVNDSTIHALGWAKENDHLPTLAAYWPDV